MRWIWLTALAFCLGFACKNPDLAPPDGTRPTARPTPKFSTHVTFLERSGRGKARYLGVEVSGELKPGGTIQLTHAFEVLEPFVGDYAIHVALEGDGQTLGTADHQPIEGRAPTSRWKKGEFWLDRHALRIPDPAPRDVTLLVAMFAGDTRLTVEGPPGASDGSDRAKAATFSIAGGASDLPETTIHRATGPIVADGVIDESAWAKAEILTFSDTMGRPAPTRFPTKLRMLWDDANLYVAFESTDSDISCPYKNRDDPIYEHETVELFLMPNAIPPAEGPYLELQASPSGVIFDASFTGRRKGMKPAWNAGQNVGTKLDGTLNDAQPDRGWVSEWVVPFANLEFVSGPPKTGDSWRMNAFRIEKFHDGDKLEGEFTAWSPPKIGDFHATPRFGALHFGD